MGRGQGAWITYPFNAGQRISRQQALDVLTRNGAAHMGRLDRGGTLEAGKVADFIVIDRNPLTAPLGEIHKTKVLMTFIPQTGARRNDWKNDISD